MIIRGKKIKKKLVDKIDNGYNFSNNYDRVEHVINEKLDKVLIRNNQKEMINIENKIRISEEQLQEKNKIIEEMTIKLRKFEQYDKQSKEKQIQLFTKLGHKSRVETRKKLSKKAKDFGRMVCERKGTSLKELWKDGDIMQHLEKKKQKIIKIQEDLKQRRKVLSLKRKALKTEIDTQKLRDLQSDVIEEDERIKLEVLKISRMEQNIKEQEEIINNKRIKHLREVKRIKDEDNSQFNNFIVLRDRYVLLKLLGKGGFSEVYKAYDLILLKKSSL